MSDSETTPNSLESIVCTRLRSLSDYCDEMIITNNQTASPDQAAPSIDQINALQALLNEMRTSLLPSLHQHLADLLNSQDAYYSGEGPRPNLQATLEILSQLKDTVKRIKSSSVSIRQAAQVPEDQDHHYAGLKRHKLDAIMVKINYTLRYSLTVVLYDHLALLEGWKDSERGQKTRIRQSLLRDSAEVLDFLQIIIHSFHASELSILQATWKTKSCSLEEHIEFLTVQIDSVFAQSLEELRDYSTGDDRSERSDEGHTYYRAEIHPSGDADHDHQQHSANILPSASSVIDQQHQQSDDVLPSATPIVDHEPEILTHEAPGEEICIEPYLVKLAQSVMPLVKLGRLLLNRLLLVPSSRAPFTIDDRMSSAEFKSLRNQTDYFFTDLLSLIRILLEFCAQNGRATFDEVRDELERALISFDRCMDVLRPRLIPYSPSYHSQLVTTPLPECEKIFNDWFALLIDQVHLAARNLRVEMEVFEKTYAVYIIQS
ncbi:hypothetical protein PGTUg99_021331 [Puccinia graminis f. sp. tritici]|uniref:Uncharacterized protein n=1 Tax=Puccinia graminis f. sp. tritici TaxID=56615 RepID=A0A5B0NHX1_PUCGR|nr:hypothetical protein PGTUg99_021331 [Puccinia graminis f. sp. tritici]